MNKGIAFLFQGFLSSSFLSNFTINVHSNNKSEKNKHYLLYYIWYLQLLYFLMKKLSHHISKLQARYFSNVPEIYNATFFSLPCIVFCIRIAKNTYIKCNSNFWPLWDRLAPRIVKLPICNIFTHFKCLLFFSR